MGYRLPTEAEWEFAALPPPVPKEPVEPKSEDTKPASKETKEEAAPKEEKKPAKTLKIHTYAGDDDIRLVGWYQDNSESIAQMAGLLKPNERGVYDLSGNLWEWCHDWYGSYEQMKSKDPTGSTHGVYRVLRGGSFASPAQDTRIRNRFRRYPTFRSNQIGFRLARTAPPKPKKENIDKK